MRETSARPARSPATQSARLARRALAGCVCRGGGARFRRVSASPVAFWHGFAGETAAAPGPRAARVRARRGGRRAGRRSPAGAACACTTQQGRPGALAAGWVPRAAAWGCRHRGAGPASGARAAAGRGRTRALRGPDRTGSGEPGPRCSPAVQGPWSRVNVAEVNGGGTEADCAQSRRWTEQNNRCGAAGESREVRVAGGSLWG